MKINTKRALRILGVLALALCLVLAIGIPAMAENAEHESTVVDTTPAWREETPYVVWELYCDSRYPYTATVSSSDILKSLQERYGENGSYKIKVSGSSYTYWSESNNDRTEFIDRNTESQAYNLYVVLRNGSTIERFIVDVYRILTIETRIGDQVITNQVKVFYNTGYTGTVESRPGYEVEVEGASTFDPETGKFTYNKSKDGTVTITYTKVGCAHEYEYDCSSDCKICGESREVSCNYVDGVCKYCGDVEFPVAIVNGKEYATLAKAIAAAQAGQTITFVADITEDVTISKAVTIDGAGKTYTGKMTLKADTTIKNVNFDGKGYNGYAVETRGAQYVTIEDCTAKNYGYGFVQMPSATALTTVKNVTISNVNYGVKIDYSSKVVFENVDITAGVAAVLNSNYGGKTINIKDSKLNIIGTYTRNNTIKTNYVFEGENTVDKFIIEEALDTFKLAKDATLTAPEAITVITDAEGYDVNYKDGKYVVVEHVDAVVMIGEQGYATLTEALAAAQAGDTITFVADITEDVTISKAVTIDGAGKTYTGAMTLKADTTIKNVNFDGKGYNGYAITTRGANYLTIEDCTAKNYGYGFVQLASATALTTVKNVTVSNMNYGVKVDYSGAVALENVDITASVAAVLNSNYGEKTITIKNSKLNILGTWTRNNTIKTNYVFEGANTIGSFITDAAIDNFKLAAGATLAAPEGITVTTDAAGCEVAYNNGVYSVVEEKQPSGEVAYRADVTDKADREGIAILLKNVYAKNSLVVKVYHNNTLMFTSTRRDIDDEGKVMFPVTANTTANIVLWGKESGSWINELLVAPTELNVPNKIEVWADGELVSTYTNSTGTVLGDQLNKYLALDCVKKAAAQVGETKYMTLAAALAAAKDGDTITLLADAEIKGYTIADGVKITIDLNGKNLTLTSPSYGAHALTVNGELTIEGEGNVEVKPFVNLALGIKVIGKLTIDGGNYSAPRGNIGSVSGTLVINGGSFACPSNTSIFNTGSNSKLTIEGGKFSHTPFEEREEDYRDINISGGSYGSDEVPEEWIAEGHIVVKVDGNSVVRTGKWLAKVGEEKFESLDAAIKAATADQTITFLADINESVTINKNLTIDGNGKTYTGQMKLTSKCSVTIKNVHFDGKGYNGYAIEARGVYYLTIEDCTATDYAYGLLQQASATVLTTVKNVTITDMSYGLKIDYGANVVLENVDIDANTGIYDSNRGDKTYTIKNSKISSIKIWERAEAKTTTFKFVGVNEVSTLSTSAYAKYEGVQVGTKIYESLTDAWAAAQDGDTIKLLGNVAVSEGIINTKKVTLDLNGKTITGTDNATGSFAIITNKSQLTITGNGKITLKATNDRDWNAYSSVISNTVGGKLIVENGTIEHLGGTDMAYGIDNLTNGKGTYAETIINGGTIKSTYRAIRMFLNGIEAQNILTVNGGVIEGANKSIWMQDPSKNANTGKLTVTEDATLNGDVYLTVTAGSTEWPVEVSIAASAVKNKVLTSNVPAGYVLEKKSGNWVVNEYFFKLGNKYYSDLQTAINAATQYQSVILLQDAEGPGVVINKKTSIDFRGFTYTLTSPVGSTGTASNGFQILSGNYTVRLLNGTLKVSDNPDIADKFYILVQNYSDLIVQNMTLDGTNLDKYAFTDGDSYTLSNNSGNVQINNSKIIANKDGDKAFAFDACDQSKYYKLPSVLVYSSSTIEGKIEAAAKVGNRYYATFAQAFEAAEEGTTITLFAPVVVNAGEELNLNKNVTISYTSSVAGEDMITNRGTLIVDGATLVYNNKDVTGSNVTVSTISCEPGSVLEIKSGIVKNNSKNNASLGIYAYAIDMLTNGGLGDVTVSISGGEVISTNYMAIRQFNNGTACENTLNVTGGKITAAKRAIQIHLKNNAAYTNISGGEIKGGDYALCFLTTSENIEVTGGKFIGDIWYSGTDAFITGGTFDATVEEAYIRAGYKMVKVDGVYNVIVDTAYGSVATIGDAKYNTFADAWAAAQDGDTIVLQNNIAVDTETFTVADEKKITLDMNGYTITVTDNATKNYELFYIYGEMVVTGKGTIELTSTTNREWNAMSAIFHNRGGKLTIENGTFTNLGGTDMAWVVDNSGNWYGNATTVINDGTLTSTYTAIRNRMEQNTHGASGEAILVINGGTIDGTTSAIWAQAASTSTVAPATGSITVNGGNIGVINTARSEGAVSMTTIAGGTVAGFKGESGELKVNGGTITGDITICFADGEVAEKIVKKSNVYYAAVAKINKTYYATLADAIKANTGAQAITLVRDVEVSGFTVTKKMSLDLNGHTVTLTAPVGETGCGIQINTDKAVRIVNGTLKVAENAGINVLIENNGSALTIQKQTLEAANVKKVLVVNSGSASLNYATINAEGAVAFEVNGTAKVTVYTSSKISGTINGKRSGNNYTAKN